MVVTNILFCGTIIKFLKEKWINCLDCQDYRPDFCFLESLIFCLNSFQILNFPPHFPYISPLKPCPTMSSPSSQPDLIGFIWNIANKLRGPYHPPQYRKVMPPMIVLKRLDCVLEQTKVAAFKQYEAFKTKRLTDNPIHKVLGNMTSGDRIQPLYKISPYPFQRLLEDSEGLPRNLSGYIHGFSPDARPIFEKFEFYLWFQLFFLGIIPLEILFNNYKSGTHEKNKATIVDNNQRIIQTLGW